VREQTAGADDRIRTGDLLITNQLLYQLSYVGLTLVSLSFAVPGVKARYAKFFEAVAGVELAPESARLTNEKRLDSNEKATRQQGGLFS
jgi:hypothetical protein